LEKSGASRFLKGFKKQTKAKLCAVRLLKGPHGTIWEQMGVNLAGLK